MRKILLFTKSAKPSPQEQEMIDLLIDSEFEICIRQSDAILTKTANIEPCDYVLGSPPAGYENVPEWDFKILPESPSEATVKDGDIVTTGDGIRYQFQVSDGNITGITQVATTPEEG
ncbi:hypothetical protein [Achromobacter phage nyashin_LB6]|nr:hypothetical protein [Achromobacter phage nyashin_LB6]